MNSAAPLQSPDQADGLRILAAQQAPAPAPADWNLTPEECSYLAGLKAYAWHDDRGRLMVGVEGQTYEAAARLFVEGRRRKRANESARPGGDDCR